MGGCGGETDKIKEDEDLTKEHIYAQPMDTDNSAEKASGG